MQPAKFIKKILRIQQKRLVRVFAPNKSIGMA
ncbi:hypothetical protein N483_04915 [Pseudoalteromonas luteoviolacea NCIMB 1944]|nr:hypothetical protein N483_04915 [Pseudoalteromonas luteoviolacea NCIMB 1944]